MGKDLVSHALRKRSASVDSPFINHDGDHGMNCTLSHEYLKTDPAFNPSQVAGTSPSAVTTSANTTPPRLPRLRTAKASSKEVAGSILHPKRTIFKYCQGKTAKSLSKATRPYITPQADREFLAAHDALFEAKKNGDKAPARKTRGRKGTPAARREKSPHSRENGVPLGEYQPLQTDAEIQTRKVELLEAHRQSIIIAWITTRHIKAVRVTPSRIADFPRLDDEKFIERDANGVEIRFRWDRYLGQPFTARYVDVDEWKSPLDMVALVERLVMATEPWQAWWMSIRDLYRWENPRRTAIWYAVFAVLWHTQHVVGFLYAYILYITLKNKFYPSNADAIRESLDRSLDREAQAYHFGEMVDRYGREKWLEPLLDQIAPFIRVQLGDLVTLLEITRNFYYWRDPRKTAASLFFFFSCLLVTLLTDMEFCMKVVWFVAINVFFLCWPIASRYPRYRYFVSPFRWIFWDVPSYPEWAIRFLQEHESLRRHEIKTHGLAHSKNTYSHDIHSNQEDTRGDAFHDAAETREHIAEKFPYQETDSIKSDNEDTASPYVQSVYFTAYQHGREGQLILTSEGIRFVENPHLLTTFHQKRRQLLDQEPRWSLTYAQLLQMTKQRSPKFSKLAGLDLSLKRLDFEFSTDNTNASEEVFKGNVWDIKSSYHTMAGGKRTRIESVDVNQAERDEIFNLIVGWSKSRWQATSGQDNWSNKN
ncbi:hypothetical protein TSTA_116110 [Talaromyces stipitatus ATCC 10500]|uniref:Uncharacterized protein n=1 Tax=Talaromyces stipitatus (strain ATCC 10500 / CBS 375.48 / QM 6759 / NRRL 1006) TaxID=441959 RepID=B8MBF7_TALSN|nr:uncharacterized protein TSTA_116110 [Talaromyces stipitatus ATCC 10500]EED17821.1 hypothetical protein TSTA_116110 [Talaromyces stipitatus ATCC 10500]